MSAKMELYRKYRPTSFDDIVGNQAVIKALQKELENGSHVFLMTGPAGCGKTTIARIMARQVGAGDLSVHEINSADNRGIETARDIMEQMRYNASDGEAIAWILDEMHMITSAGQNALLKALEDTPSHVYFFLCTTDPQKLIAPLKTRCSIINVKPLSDEEMLYLLRRTARAEKIKLTEDVYSKVVELAGGSSRKGLKLLAKVLYLDDSDRLEALKAEDVADSPETIELCRALMKKNCSWSLLAPILKKMDMSDSEKIRMAVMGYMNAVLLGGTYSGEAISALQAFSANNTYSNGKFQITVACLDTLAMRQ